MNFNLKELKESVRIKANTIQIKVFTASGKDGDYFFIVSPALMISGYGNTPAEAEGSFKHNIKVFCDDIIKSSVESREAHLKKLGFTKENFKSKNFSKLYVDDKGTLQGLDHSELKTSLLEAVI